MNKSRASFKSVFLAILVLSLLGFGGVLAYDQWQSSALEGPDAPNPTSLGELDQNEAHLADASDFTETSLPNELNIDLPFYTQAPTGNWDYPWQDACEEASIALVANVYLNKNWTRDEFNQQLLDLVDWQGKNGMDYHDTTITETAELMKANYGLESTVHENPSFKDIQKILAQGHLIVAPFAGKELGNPNFTNGGPVYHMVVIKGYNASKEQVVTHDVGTRNGADYVYSWSVLEHALHDWDPDNIDEGAKLILEVLPPSL